MNEMDSVQVAQDVSAAEALLAADSDQRPFRFWQRMQVTPTQWQHTQYEHCEPFWVVAVLGKRCMYFNAVEESCGWGRFRQWGEISEYHYEQLEIQHVVFQTLFAIDEGGKG